MNEDGDVYSFGNNEYGQCGVGNNDKTILAPTKIMNNPNITSIVLGIHNSFYVEKNGDLYGCGLNE